MIAAACDAADERKPPSEEPGLIYTMRPVPRVPARMSMQLLRAAHDGDAKLVKALLDASAERPIDLNAADEFGRTPLLEAVRHERLEVLVLLLGAGAGVNCARRSDGATALMLAAQCGAAHVVAVLLQYGADWRAVNSDGETAAEVARAAHDDGTVAALEAWAFEHGDEAETAAGLVRRLVEASSAGDATRVRELLEAGAAVDGADEYGRTALIEASRHNDVAVVAALLGGEADVNLARLTDGWTPLITAAYHGCVQALDILINEGAADLTLTNQEGQTALDMARWPWRTPLEFEKWKSEKVAVQKLEEAIAAVQAGLAGAGRQWKKRSAGRERCGDQPRAQAGSRGSPTVDYS
jgi:ankyrin repeat protein